MKAFLQFILAAAILSPLTGFGQSSSSYTNFIRQIQYPSGVVRDVSVGKEGTQESPLSIEPGGALFELWTVKNNPLTNYLLDSQYVGTYIPQATVEIFSEDPYTVIPRTRADRPYWVTMTVSGLLNGETDPPASKNVHVTLHSQSYGENGTGEDIDRDDAILRAQGMAYSNGTYNLTFTNRFLPSDNGDATKTRGEERFSAYSIEDYQAPAEVLSSRYIQIWPIADATITGISQNALYKAKLPTVNIELNDLYPDTRVYAQVYPGEPQLGVEGTIVEGSALIINHAVPQDRTLTLTEWDDPFLQDGRWTLEVITITPFGKERLGHVTFELDRTIQMNGSVTTVE